MKNAWDDMKKAKEEQYFKEKDKEIIEREHEVIEKAHEVIEKEELKANYAGHCPKCGEKLIEEDFHGVNIDRCHSCKGMWLDYGELDILTHEEAAKSWFEKIWSNR